MFAGKDQSRCAVLTVQSADQFVAGGTTQSRADRVRRTAMCGAVFLWVSDSLAFLTDDDVSLCYIYWWVELVAEKFSVRCRN